MIRDLSVRGDHPPAFHPVHRRALAGVVGVRALSCGHGRFRAGAARREPVPAGAVGGGGRGRGRRGDGVGVGAAPQRGHLPALARLRPRPYAGDDAGARRAGRGGALAGDRHVSAVLRMDSVAIAFDGRDVLSSVYFEARAGVVTALVGRNGTGKSTLMKIAAGWARPDRGFVELRGKRLTARPVELARGGVFHLPVDRTILSRDFTLAQHLDAVEARFGDGDRTAVLDRLAVAHLADQRSRSLSGGEHRRAELSVAMGRRAAGPPAGEPLPRPPPPRPDRT